MHSKRIIIYLLMVGSVMLSCGPSEKNTKLAGPVFGTSYAITYYSDSKLDFQKAFDSIHRDTMWSKALRYGIPDKIVNVMKAIYKNTKCCIRLGERNTKEFDIVTGVRQGCILSPFLFILVIDYIIVKLVWNFATRGK